MYSPKVPEKFIPALYRLGKERKEPMTRLVAQAVADFLDKEQASGKRQEVLSESRSSNNPVESMSPLPGRSHLRSLRKPAALPAMRPSPVPAAGARALRDNTEGATTWRQKDGNYDLKA